MSHIARGRNGPCVHQGGKSNQRQTSQSHCYRKHFTEFTFQLRQFNYIIIVTVNGTKKKDGMALIKKKGAGTACNSKMLSFPAETV